MEKIGNVFHKDQAGADNQNARSQESRQNIPSLVAKGINPISRLVGIGLHDGRASDGEGVTQIMNSIC